MKKKWTYYCVLCLLISAVSEREAYAELVLSAEGPLIVWTLLKTGQPYEAGLVTKDIQIQTAQGVLEIPFSDVLSLNTASQMSDDEKHRVDTALNTLLGENRGVNRGVGTFMQTNPQLYEIATAQLEDIGLPVITPLFTSLPDIDGREPKPAYRVYDRIIPAGGDCADRTLDLIRLNDGQILRGKILNRELELKIQPDKTEVIIFSDIRRLAVRQKQINRILVVDSFRHCTQIEFLDTGIILTGDSELEQTAQGYVRLCYNPDLDCWSADADGLTPDAPTGKPTNIFEGFPFAALIGRVGPEGPCWLAGCHVKKTGLPTGRLYFAVNDNSHWQNNIGSFCVNLKVTNAYDMSQAQ